MGEALAASIDVPPPLCDCVGEFLSYMAVIFLCHTIKRLADDDQIGRFSKIKKFLVRFGHNQSYLPGLVPQAPF
jgi:hypothetical protein